jgi:hypothetical protein
MRRSKIDLMAKKCETFLQVLRTYQFRTSYHNYIVELYFSIWFWRQN